MRIEVQVLCWNAFAGAGNVIFESSGPCSASSEHRFIQIEAMPASDATELRAEGRPGDDIWQELNGSGDVKTLCR